MHAQVSFIVSLSLTLLCYRLCWWYFLAFAFVILVVTTASSKPGSWKLISLYCNTSSYSYIYVSIVYATESIIVLKYELLILSHVHVLMDICRIISIKVIHHTYTH